MRMRCPVNTDSSRFFSFVIFGLLLINAPLTFANKRLYNNLHSGAEKIPACSDVQGIEAIWKPPILDEPDVSMGPSYKFCLWSETPVLVRIEDRNAIMLKKIPISEVKVGMQILSNAFLKQGTQYQSVPCWDRVTQTIETEITNDTELFTTKIDHGTTAQNRWLIYSTNVFSSIIIAFTSFFAIIVSS